MVDSYEQVPYPGTHQSTSHPARMSALACLYGRRFPSVSRCRVLELGCGDGTNLLSMAATAPNSQLVGIDLAEGAIAEGRATAIAAGLTNVEFMVMDIKAVPPSLGEFDYIVAHGVYAWVAPTVREALMGLIGRALTPDGLAFVSYNTMPACRVRQIVRDILQDHIRTAANPADMVTAAEECLKFYTGVWSEFSPLPNALRDHVLQTLQRPPEVIFHDEMAEFFEPQFVSDVAAHAAVHGLQYLCDTNPSLNHEAFFPSSNQKSLRERAKGDWIRYEQLHDYVSLVQFRRTILCRSEGNIDRRADWTRLRQLHAQGLFDRAEAEESDSRAFVFRTRQSQGGGGQLSTNDPKLAALIACISEHHPGSLPLADASTGPEVGEAILRLFLADMLSLQTEPLPFARRISERPLASGLARAQASRGHKRLSSLHHSAVEIDDPESRHFITLLDGTRSRQDLATEMAQHTGIPIATVSARLDDSLAGLARAALLAS
ncbi:class I SAM-dependent methyltransferase [Bradyrhizobium jicamae]|uniref:Class I SAM-dependent methyltransferase n=1 Tax=Bradyrhizobium jicamae TaxID=280332 RepID=A0ABS5FRC9_9BRAD|nr:class I SAM-dependent methyltransferase [Bradyrhizobium jicamae]MBR0799368.1 class I SAM-dependent methyltransferase [Bradyrhizobium jicamae]MBR0936600.1 class I SAM-dependent methyltransferase [Bradyrhizobium jicamae]